MKSLDISPLSGLREKLTGNPRSIIDVNLGKLAKHMRMLGFDSLYANDYSDSEVVNIAVHDHRHHFDPGPQAFVSQTGNSRLLGASGHRNDQVDEGLQRFGLYDSIYPFRRCLVCNGVLVPVAKADVIDGLKPETRLYYQVFHQCTDCRANLLGGLPHRRYEATPCRLFLRSKLNAQ